MERPNLAGRAGRWSAANWKKAFFGWLLFAVVAMLLGRMVGHVQMADSQFANGEVARAITMLEQANFTQPALENVLIQSKTETVDSNLMQAAVGGVVQTLAVRKDVTNLRDPRTLPGSGGLVSRDGHSVLVQFTVRGDPDKAKDRIAPILAAVAGAQQANSQRLDPRDRQCERHLRDRQDLRQGLRERRTDDHPDHADHPARRLRRARRRGPPGVARDHCRARLARPLRGDHTRLRRRLRLHLGGRSS